MSRGRKIPGRDRQHWRAQGHAAIGRVRRKLAEGTRTVARTAESSAPGDPGTSGRSGADVRADRAGEPGGRSDLGGRGGRKA